jgi:hypothetical protein
MTTPANGSTVELTAAQLIPTMMQATTDCRQSLPAFIESR